jgi:hypothetical protein
MTTDAPDFDGETYEHDSDHARLMKQLDRVRELMLDGAWRTLAEISAATGDPAASVSAQLRHLRKERFGGFTVDKRSRGDRSAGLFEYKLRKPACYQQAVPAREESEPAPPTRRLTQAQAATWLAALMDLTNEAAEHGCTIPADVYELEKFLNERKQ